MYSRQNLQPNGFLTVSTFSFTLGDTTLNSSCPQDFNHSCFWNHNPLSPLFYAIRELSLEANEQILWVLEPRKGWVTGANSPLNRRQSYSPLKTHKLRQLQSRSENKFDLWLPYVNVSHCLTRNDYLQILGYDLSHSSNVRSKRVITLARTQRLRLSCTGKISNRVEIVPRDWDPSNYSELQLEDLKRTFQHQIPQSFSFAICPPLFYPLALRCLDSLSSFSNNTFRTCSGNVGLKSFTTTWG